MASPWIKNAPNLLIVNTILAALAGVLLVLVIQDQHFDFDDRWLFPVSLFGLSLYFFVLTAERICESLEEERVGKHVAYMAPYNIGVISLFFGIATLTHYRYQLSWYWLAPIAFFFSFPWIKHFSWLLFESHASFQNYLESLEGHREPEEEPHLWPRVFFWWRNIFARWRPGGRRLPHIGVYTRIETSQTHGVGVFAITDIPEGTRLFEGDETEISWVKEQDLHGLAPALRKLYDDFCIIKEGKYGCPRPNFNNLTMSWYLNDSDDPNVRVDNDYHMWALRDIKTGDELTIDSSKFSEQPYKKRI